MQQLTPRLGWAGLGLACLALTACENAASERSFERFDSYSEILSTAATRDLADLSDLTGTATYTGVASAVFPAEVDPPPEDPNDPDSAPDARTYSADADVELVADFTGGTLSGEMTGWTPEDPGNFSMRGLVRISDGQIQPDGTFDALVTGSVERRMTARRIQELADSDEEFDLPQDFLVGIVGEVTGTFHDSVTGQSASHIIGTVDAGNMSGSFVANR